ncbi:MAG: DUF1064 domain-containing protein [Ruminococcus flavefaciens]|nr:DUF1064 domain-containing protein [Ruminococcus flavefaciens]MCM1060119.1 DUF1064 domain-containing protein [Eubacterium sp.]
MARSKFNVDKNTAKRTYNGITFDSELEMKYYRDVVLPGMESGHIKYYELQKPYELQPKFVHDGKIVQPIKYVADFYIEYADGSSKVIDTKGIPDSTAVVKRKMFWYVYPDIRYIWITYSKIDGGWCSYEYVKQQRNLRKKNKRNKEKNHE